MIKKLFSSILHLLLAPLAVALGLWYFLLSRNSFIAFMGMVYVRGDHDRSVQVRVMEKFFFIFVGLVFAAFALTVFEYTRQSFQKKTPPGKPTYVPRMLLAIGIELLLIFTADLVYMWAQHFNSTPLRWALLAGELALGIVLTIRSYQAIRKMSARFVNISPQVGGPW